MGNVKYVCNKILLICAYPWAKTIDTMCWSYSQETTSSVHGEYWDTPHIVWLVVSTPLKILVNSQQEGLSHILWKIKNVRNHQPATHCRKETPPCTRGQKGGHSSSSSKESRVASSRYARCQFLKTTGVLLHSPACDWSVPSNYWLKSWKGCFVLLFIRCFPNICLFAS